MHAGVRRMPAERARHAKRLGHVQRGMEPAFQVRAASVSTAGTGTTATTSQSATSATTTSSQITSSTTTNRSSSSALPSSSPSQSSSLAPSSAATSASASIAASVTTQSPAVTVPSPSLITPPIPSTSTSPTSSSTPTPQTNAASGTSSGLSGGAIAGIIAGAVIVGTVLIVFLIRKTVLRRRERKHISWNMPPGLHDPKPSPDVSERPASFNSVANTPQRNAALSPFEAHGQPMYSTPVPVGHIHPPTYAAPTPPPATYNNPTPVAAYPTQPVPSIYNPGSTAALAMARAPAGTGIPPHLPVVRAQHAPMEVIVKCTFVPTLPDELSIATGERIFIVEQYDDGWDLCVNGRGERGMVPRECLERAPSDQPDVGWRNVKRMSSLNTGGRRF